MLVLIIPQPRGTDFHCSVPEKPKNEVALLNGRCLLITLPPELRNKIYRLAMQYEDQPAVIPKHIRGPDVLREPSLLETCRAIPAEASPIFYTFNEFRIILKTVQFGSFTTWLHMLVKRPGCKPFGGITIAVALPFWSEINCLLPFVQLCVTTGLELTARPHKRSSGRAKPIVPSTSVSEANKSGDERLYEAMNEVYDSARRGYAAGATAEKAEEVFKKWADGKRRSGTTKSSIDQINARLIKRSTGSRWPERRK